MYKLILASASARRSQILSEYGIPFEVIKSDCEEYTEFTKPSQVVTDLSLQKARDVAQKAAASEKYERQDILVLSADTIVSYNGEILGKPEDEQDAFDMLTGKCRASHGYPLWQLESAKTEENPFAPYQLQKKTRYRKYHPDGRTRAAIRLEGRMIGGCLDCLKTLLGTRFDRVEDFNRRYGDEGILWFLESCDLNVLDMRRTLWQMKNAGWFDRASGFLIGRPLHYGEKIMELDQYEAVLSQLREINVPVLMDLDFGHLPPTMPLICGAHARVQCRGSRIAIDYDL